MWIIQERDNINDRVTEQEVTEICLSFCELEWENKEIVLLVFLQFGHKYLAI